MKKHFGTNIIMSILLALFILPLMPQRAMAVTASLSGSSSVRAGDTIVLTLSVGDSISGISADVSFSGNLKFSAASSPLNSWTSLYKAQEDGTVRISSYGSAASGKVFTLSFVVSGNEGDALSVKLKNLIGSSVSGDSDIDLTGGAGSVSWSGTVAGKPSSVCHLTDIRCSNATLSPAFNKDTTYYTANVPYSVSKLALDYDRADKQGSSVAISDTNLAVGANTITLKVTAADGSTKTYTLSVTRQQDPNYKPGTDAALKELHLDTATLSPAFKPDCTDYVAYVPFETKEATLSGVARDEKAVTSGEKKVTLTKEGASDVSVVCTAEDGKTTKTYTVHVFRMPAYTGILPTVEIRESTETDVPTLTNIEEEAPALTIPAVVKLPFGLHASTVLIGVILLVVVLALLFLLAFLIGRGRREDDYAEDDLDDEPAQAASEPVPKRIQPNPVYEEEQLPAEEPDTVTPPVQEEAPAGEVPQEKPQAAPHTDEDIRAAAEVAENMSLDELLEDIRDM